MEMLSVFTDVLHVSNLSSPQHLGAILSQNDAFSKQEVRGLFYLFKQRYPVDGKGYPWKTKLYLWVSGGNHCKQTEGLSNLHWCEEAAGSVGHGQADGASRKTHQVFEQAWRGKFRSANGTNQLLEFCWIINNGVDIYIKFKILFLLGSSGSTL